MESRAVEYDFRMQSTGCAVLEVLGPGAFRGQLSSAMASRFDSPGR